METYCCRYSTGRLMRKFSHRGLSIKNNNSKRLKEEKKTPDLITISARENSGEGKFSIRMDSYIPEVWFKIEVGVKGKTEERGRWREKKNLKKQTAKTVKAAGVGVMRRRCWKWKKYGGGRGQLNKCSNKRVRDKYGAKKKKAHRRMKMKEEISSRGLSSKDFLKKELLSA